MSASTLAPGSSPIGERRADHLGRRVGGGAALTDSGIQRPTTNAVARAASWARREDRGVAPRGPPEVDDPDPERDLGIGRQAAVGAAWMAPS